MVRRPSRSGWTPRWSTSSRSSRITADGRFVAVFSAQVIEHLAPSTCSAWWTRCQGARRGRGRHRSRPSTRTPCGHFRFFWLDRTHTIPVYPESALVMARSAGFPRRRSTSLAAPGTGRRPPRLRGLHPGLRQAPDTAGRASAARRPERGLGLVSRRCRAGSGRSWAGPTGGPRSPSPRRPPRYPGARLEVVGLAVGHPDDAVALLAGLVAEVHVVEVQRQQLGEPPISKKTSRRIAEQAAVTPLTSRLMSRAPNGPGSARGSPRKAWRYWPLS